jgi:hypothetical protein
MWTCSGAFDFDHVYTWLSAAGAKSHELLDDVSTSLDDVWQDEMHII